MDMRSHVQKLFRFTRTAVLVSFRLWERQRERAGTLNLAKEYAESETYQIGIAIILATLMLLAATVAGAQPVADNLAKRKPEAVIDLATRAGVQLVRGEWRYSDTKIVEVDFKSEEELQRLYEQLVDRTDR